MYRRIELDVRIPGPKLPGTELELIEETMLARFSPALLADIQSGKTHRCVDHTGNYFLLFGNKERE